MIVSNTTPLSELCKIDRLDLLQILFTTVVIPEEVHTELIAGNHPAATAIPSAPWIEVCPLKSRDRVELLLQTPGLDRGECAAIALAEELNATRLLIDERIGRQLALQLKIPATGTIGVLLSAKQGIFPLLKPLVDSLIAQGTWISPNFYHQILQMADELPSR